jgi:hypothetical protein
MAFKDKNPFLNLMILPSSQMSSMKPTLVYAEATVKPINPNEDVRIIQSAGATNNNIMTDHINHFVSIDRNSNGTHPKGDF